MRFLARLDGLREVSTSRGSECSGGETGRDRLEPGWGRECHSLLNLIRYETRKLTEGTGGGRITGRGGIDGLYQKKIDIDCKII